MAYGGHPDHGLSGVAGQHEAGTGMESEYGGKAIGAPGGAPAGQNEMGAFLDAMSKRYGPQSVKNFVDGYLSRHFNFQTLGQPLNVPAQGYRNPNYSSQTFGIRQNAPVIGIENTEAQTSTLDYGVPPGAMANPSPVSPEFGTELEMSGRLTPAQLAALDAAQQNTQNFTNFEAYADPSVLADAMPAPNYGPAYGGGGDQLFTQTIYGGDQAQMMPAYWIERAKNYRAPGSFSDQ
jgi:hypothetical protein